MKITRVVSYNFRNILKADIKPAKNLNIFVGSNAQGKSNFLESIYMFVSGRSYRTTKTSDLINFNKTKSEVVIDLEKKESSYSLYLGI